MASVDKVELDKTFLEFDFSGDLFFSKMLYLFELLIWGPPPYPDQVQSLGPQGGSDQKVELD